MNLTLGHGESLFETVVNFFVPDMPRSQHEAVLGMPFPAGINPTVDRRRRVTAVPAEDPDRPVEVPAQAEPPPEMSKFC